MITVVIGHRGTGKTELMKRLQVSLPAGSAEFVDLDHEIEMKIGKTIMELFLEHGEAYFRELERQLFLETLQKPHKDMYLFVGAGFDVNVLPETVRTLWVRRKTDLDGRIFLNRPRLNPEMSPLEEFLKRAKQREENYAKVADEVYLMPEGLFENHHFVLGVEKAILTHTATHIGGCLTLLPSLHDKPLRWQMFKDRFAQKGIELFELRDDFLTLERIQQTLQEMPGEKFLFSFREVKDRREFWTSPEWSQILARSTWIDWPLELGSPEEVLNHVPKEKLIISCHDMNEFEALQSYENLAAHLKFAPIVKSYSELWVYHQWQKAVSSHRSFLPRSENGRWAWYRQLQIDQQLINFWRDGEGSAGDQPSLFQWLMTPQHPVNFAAVLGAPVEHSFTPIEHAEFFHKRNLPVFAVHIEREEWDEAMPILQKLGLQYAAVTAPHKEAAAKWCGHKELFALNTLYFNKGKQQWVGTSTDDAGFLELIEGVGMIAPLQKEIFVWGGGGTLGMIQKALPHASYFSSRQGAARPGTEDLEGVKPKILIWAAPRGPETVLPPKEWDPAMVYDLNYKEDSMGREYAQLSGANYQSGLTMFIAQAQLQRVFWQKCEDDL
ncbi:shikimate kinase [Bdellovibrio svalbardensis]|uniref:Shikimate synthase n=1 Tax=Bdellovibrio svalbardensis TaxID=2972972 RepID=A0ABT6DEL8_9BACT|nr:shikimate kinase [Bdellovibrio svalbardensis]MDG0815273.1 shikimate synthase [Bdellovibrio svalbardensis]